MQQPHREAIEGLAKSIRALCDAAVSTGAEPAVIARARAAIDGATELLAAEHDEGPYSGLLGPNPDYSDPHAFLPLSPVIGPCNPVAPDVRLRFEDGCVRGRARLGKTSVGPPWCAHGGVGALIADQLVALGPPAIGRIGYATAEMRVRYRRPTPLFEELTLEAHCEPGEDPDTALSVATIRAGDVVTIEAEATMRDARKLMRDPSRIKAREPV